VRSVEKKKKKPIGREKKPSPWGVGLTTRTKDNPGPDGNGELN